MSGISGTSAFGTRNFDVGKKLYVEIDGAGTVTNRTTQFSGVIGKIAGFVTEPFGIVGFGKNFTQFVVYVGIGTYVNPDWRGVNQFDLLNAVGLD